MRRLGLVVAGLIIAAVVLPPGVTGVIAQRQLESALEASIATEPTLELPQTDYERGWFSAVARYRIEMRDEDAISLARELPGNEHFSGPATLEVETRIAHGLLPLTGPDGGWRIGVPALAKSWSRIAVDAGEQRRYELPGVIQSDFHFDGSSTSRYSIAAGRHSFQQEDAQIVWEPASVEAWISAGADAIDSTGRAGGISIEDAVSRLDVGPVSFSVRQTRGAHDLWAGESRFEAESISMDAAAGSLTVGGFSVDSLVTEDGERLDVRVSADTGAISSTVWSGGPGRLRLELAGLAAEPLSRLSRALDEMPQPAGPDDLAIPLTDDARAALEALLAAGSLLRIDELSMQTEDGPIRARLRAELPPAPAGGSLQALVGSLEAEAELRAPRAVFERLLASDPQAAQMFAGLVQMGFIEERGNALVTEARLKGGLLVVNGIPLPLPLGY